MPAGGSTTRKRQRALGIRPPRVPKSHVPPSHVPQGKTLVRKPGYNVPVRNAVTRRQAAAVRRQNRRAARVRRQAQLGRAGLPTAANVRRREIKRFVAAYLRQPRFTGKDVMRAGPQFGSMLPNLPRGSLSAASLPTAADVRRLARARQQFPGTYELGALPPPGLASPGQLARRQRIQQLHPSKTPGWVQDLAIGIATAPIPLGGEGTAAKIGAKFAKPLARLGIRGVERLIGKGAAERGIATAGRAAARAGATRGARGAAVVGRALARRRAEKIAARGVVSRGARAHAPLPVLGVGGSHPETRRLPRIPLETARALATSGKARERTVSGLAQLLPAILAAPVQLGANAVTEGPGRALSEFGKTAGADYSRRYGPLLRGEKGAAEAFRKRLQEEGAAPELLDLTGAAAAGGATIGRALGRSARAGMLGRRLERVAKAERPRLRTSGGDQAVREQLVAHNLFRALGQRAEDRLRRRNVSKRNVKARAHGRGIPGLQPLGPNEVVRATRALQGRGMRMAAAELSARGFHGLRQRIQQYERAARANVARLDKRQRRAFVMGLEGMPLEPVDARAWALRRKAAIRSERSGQIAAARTRLDKAERRLANARTPAGTDRAERAVAAARADAEKLRSVPAVLRSRTEELRVLDEIIQHPHEIFDDKFREVVTQEQERSRMADALNVSVHPATAEARRLRVQGEMMGVPHPYTQARDALKAAARKAQAQTKDPAERVAIREARDADLSELDRRKPELDRAYSQSVREARTIPGKEAQVTEARAAASEALRGLATTPREVESAVAPFREATGNYDAINRELRVRAGALGAEPRGQVPVADMQRRDFEIEQMKRLELAANLPAGPTKVIREKSYLDYMRQRRDEVARETPDELPDWESRTYDQEQLVRALDEGYDPRPESIRALTWYHGTRHEIKRLDADLGDEAALMGQGVYLTSSRPTAEGYARTTRGPQVGRVYEAKVRPERILDLEAPVPDGIAESFIRIAARSAHPEELAMARADFQANVHTTADAVRWLQTDVINEVGPDAAREALVDARLALIESGFDAMTHLGGRRIGPRKHQVLILLDPEAMYAAEQPGRGGRVVESIRETKPGPQRIHDMQRELYTGPFPRSEVFDGGMEHPEFRRLVSAHRRREDVWNDNVRRAIAHGLISPREAAQRGYRHASFEPVREGPGWGSPSEPDYQVLPKRLYHVTTARTQVSRQGRLLSRAEQNARQGKYRSGAGLGSGPEETISLTDNYRAARNIHDVLVEANAVLSGRIPLDQILEIARRQGFLDQLDSMTSGANHIPGTVSQELRDVLANVTHDRINSIGRWEFGDLPPTAAELRAHGYTPVETYPAMSGDHYFSWTRPMTETERLNKTWRVYRDYLTTREHHGDGRVDPLFMSTDVGRLAQLDPSEIGVVEVHPKPGAKGLATGDRHNAEWRIPTGELVNIVDRPIEPAALRNVERTQADVMAAEHLPEQAAREIAPEPGYTTHRAREGRKFADRAPGSGLRAVAPQQQSKMVLFREGRRDVSPEAYFDTLARQVKYGVSWEMVDRQYRAHALSGIDEAEIRRATGKTSTVDQLTVEDLRKILERRGYDTADWAFVNPRVLRQRQREIGTAETPEDAAVAEAAGREPIHATEPSPDVRAGFESSSLDWDAIAKMGAGRRNFEKTTGWYAVPKAAYDELDSATRPSGRAGRMLSKVMGFQSRIILGTSPSWLPFQIAANAFVAGFGLRGNVFDAGASVKWWKGLTPEEQHDFAEVLGAGILRGHGERMYLGYAGGALSNEWRAIAETPLVRRASKYNPLDLVFRADDAQNAFFRRAVLYSQVKRDAYRHMGELIPAMGTDLERIDRIRQLPPRERVTEILKNPELLERYAQKVDSFLGNWHRYTASERRIWKRGILFYGFFRYSLRTLLYTIPVKHPVMGSIMAKLGQLHEEEVADLVGGREAPWAFSRIYFGGDRDYNADTASKNLRSIDTLRANPVTDPITSALGETGPKALAGVFSPMIASALDQISDKTHFTGKGFRVRGSTAAIGEPGAPQLPFLSATRGRIFLDDLLSTHSAYRLAKTLTQKGTMGDDSLLFSPRPIRYKQATAIARETERRKAQGSSWDRFLQWLAPEFVPKPDTTPAIVAERRRRKGKTSGTGGPADLKDLDLGGTGGPSLKDLQELKLP